MKDSKGHGSDAGHGHGFVTPGGRGIMPSRPYRQGAEHQAAIADQHGISADHVTRRRDAWGRTDADFVRDYGSAPRFNTGKR